MVVCAAGLKGLSPVVFTKPEGTPLFVLLLSGYCSDDNENESGNHRNQADDEIDLWISGTEFLDVRVLRLPGIIADRICLRLLGCNRPAHVLQFLSYTVDRKRKVHAVGRSGFSSVKLSDLRDISFCFRRPTLILSRKNRSHDEKNDRNDKKGNA